MITVVRGNQGQTGVARFCSVLEGATDMVMS